MRKAQRQWGVTEKLLKNTGVTVREQAMIYKAVVQKVLLYGNKSWLVIEAIMKVL